MSGACPACDGKDLVDLYYLADIPVQSCVLLRNREEALHFPRAPLLLTACEECGFLFNSLFDSSRLDYSASSEESQHYSETFGRFARRLVHDIAARYALQDRRTLEIGCGKGDFLEALVEATGTDGLGIDPGFIPERRAGRGRSASASWSSSGRLRFQRAYFDVGAVQEAPDFVICRHTLEHIPDVKRFVADVARLVGDRADAGIFFETPDVQRVLVEGAFWDIYYEHCSYFTLGSHARLFRGAGLDVTDLTLDFGDQYIIQYARAGSSRSVLAAEDDLDFIRRLLPEVAARLEASRAQWRDLVRDRHHAGERIVLWGGGSKAVSFLTTLQVGPEIANVVDINPHRQGKYLPGSGHEVVAPEELLFNPPRCVIVMNPVYRDEISATLEAMGLRPEILTV